MAIAVATTKSITFLDLVEHPDTPTGEGVYPGYEKFTVEDNCVYYEYGLPEGVPFEREDPEDYCFCSNPRDAQARLIQELTELESGLAVVHELLAKLQAGAEYKKSVKRN